MNKGKDIAERMKEYDAHYDMFFEQGRPMKLPPSNGGLPGFGAVGPSSGQSGQSGQSDPLKAFIEGVINDNPQTQNADPTWGELLKERTMSFVDQMLRQFIPIEEHQDREQEYIDRFEKADEEKKEEMMPQVTSALHRYYQPSEVNIDGYLQQLDEGESMEAVSQALIDDWRKASDKRIQKLKADTINKNKSRWERNVRDWGRSDYEERRKLNKVFVKYPQLDEIVRMMGREQPKSKELKDDYLTQYLPILPSTPKPAAEVEEIMLGRSIRHMLPMETAVMAEREIDTLFFKRYATHQLQLFSNRPKEESAEKKIVIKKEKPRLEKGPMIVALDTSGSMYGRPLEIATFLLFRLLKVAKKQKRNCFLILFSVRAKCIDLSNMSSWSQLDGFMKNHFSGGTDGEDMIGHSLAMLKSKAYSMADILIISDFYFPLPLPKTKEAMEREQKHGTCFYGLQIGLQKCDYEKTLDKVWMIKV